MKVDFSGTLIGFKGEPVVGPDGQPIALSTVSVNALLANDEVSGEEKFKRYKLAERIADAEGLVDVSSEEISLIKNRIGIGYGPAIVGVSWSLLEG